MKVSSIKTLSDFLRYCKMPIYFKADIKKMRIGDTFFMGKLPSDFFGVDGVCEAWIEKSRGKYKFFSTFTLLTNKESRALIINSGDFTLQKGDLINFLENCDNNIIKYFSLVCRYLTFFYKNLSKDEWYRLNKSGVTPLFYGLSLDSEFITTTKRVVSVNGELKCKFINCESYRPEHQLSAIVDVGIATGNVQLH